MCFPEYMCPFRLQKEVEMNMKKLLTTTFITVFFIIGSAFSAFASENDLSDQAQQAETTENSQDSHEAESCESAEEPADHLVSLGTFKTTGYCPCKSCSAGWGRNTCTGAVASAHHTIAVDPRVIPYGTKVMINGVIYTAEDKGGGVKGHHIDIFYDTHAETRNHGIQNAEVFLLTA